MNVKQVLNLKGSSVVETILPRATVRDAANILGEKRYGALVVSHGDGTVSGILSERDIVRGIGREGPACLEKPVTSLMTSDVKCCAQEDSLDSVLERMSSGRFRHMPVIDDGRMVGILSIGDVVKAKILLMQEENAQMHTMLQG